MRVVLLNQFYPPDVAPTGRYLHELARALVGEGHEVTVIASKHAYGGGRGFPSRELLDGVEVVRLPGFGFGRATYAGELVDWVGYYAGVAIRLLHLPRPDVIVALTSPPFLGLLAKLIADMRGARHAHWVMDVYPDVMRAHGMLHAVSAAALEQLARASLNGAAAIVTLGPAMAARIGRYARASTDVSWIPLWSPEGLDPWPEASPVPMRATRHWAPERVVLMYSGNMGLGHRFGEFLEAAERLGEAGPHWAFAGTGRSRSVVERFAAEHPDLPIELLPYAPEKQLVEHLSSADVHLISLDDAWEGTLLPSKLQASFALGKPVIFIGASWQDTARWIIESGGGWVVPEGDVEGLLAAIREAHDPQERARRGKAAHAFGRAMFDREDNITRLSRALLVHSDISPKG